MATGYSKEGGWPYGTIKDADEVYKLEKQLDDGFVIRNVRQSFPHAVIAQSR